MIATLLFCVLKQKWCPSDFSLFHSIHEALFFTVNSLQCAPCTRVETYNQTRKRKKYTHTHSLGFVFFKILSDLHGTIYPHVRHLLTICLDIWRYDHVYLHSLLDILFNAYDNRNGFVGFILTHTQTETFNSYIYSDLLLTKFDIFPLTEMSKWVYKIDRMKEKCRHMFWLIEHSPNISPNSISQYSFGLLG